MIAFGRRSWLLLAGGLAALPLAFVQRNPLLMQWRGFLTPFLTIAAIAALWHLRSPWKRSPPAIGPRSMLFGLWLSTLLLVCAQEGIFHWRKHQILHNTPAEMQALGAHIIIGYNHPDEVKWLAQRGLVGGVFLSATSVKGKTAETIASEISELQLLRKSAGLGALVVSTDQEGGIVSRMSPPLVQMPSLAETIAGARPEDIETLAYAYGQAHGRGLASLGVNVNFAPLADLSAPRTRNALDFHSLIGQRAIDADPHRVSPAVIGYAHGLETQGVRATLKHFPGLGRVTTDTHLFRATLGAPETTLEASDWIPFREGLRATQSLLMVGHAALGAVDANQPASLSSKVVQGIVRDRWHHQGVLVTDDMAMAPVVRHGMCRAGVDAINAGIDLLLVSYDTDQYYTVMQCLVQARREGHLHEHMLRVSRQRLRQHLTF